MSIGFALTGLIKTLRSATPIIQITYFALMFLGGIFFPNSLLPKWLGNAASILPSTQMGDALRAVVYNGGRYRGYLAKAGDNGGMDRCLHGGFNTVFSLGIIHL